MLDRRRETSAPHQKCHWIAWVACLTEGSKQVFLSGSATGLYIYYCSVRKKYYWEILKIKPDRRNIFLEPGTFPYLEPYNLRRPIGWGCRRRRLHLHRGVRLTTNQCPGYNTKLHQIDEVKCHTHFHDINFLRALGSVEHPFAAIIPRFTLTRSGNTC